MSFKPGDNIGNYILKEKLGEGGFGEVWKAEHADITGKVVAIKIPNDFEYIRDLKKEAIFQHNFDHPGIVKAIDLSLHTDPPHFIMEYVDGKNLRTLLNEREKLPENEAIDLFCEICEALEYAHGKGVIHRDLKPGNILINSEGHVKISDFGLAKDAPSAAELQLSGELVSIEGKKLVGTLVYMSPEQKEGKKLDERADIYALGIIWFEMLTGERPMGAGDKPSELVSSLPGRCDTLYFRCCARLKKRYKDMASLLSEFSPPRPKGSTQSRLRASSAEQSSTAGGLIALLILLICMVLGLFTLLSDDHKTNNDGEITTTTITTTEEYTIPGYMQTPLMAIGTDETVEGPVVRIIFPGSAADKAGMKVGDIITALNGGKTTSRAVLARLIRRHSAGEVVHLSALRDGWEIELKVRLAELP